MAYLFTGRLIIAVVTTVIEEAILAALVLWGLPQLGIHVPLSVLIGVMVVWATNAIVFYRIGSRALRRRPVSGLGSVVGDRGKVISPLVPDGVIRIRDELWEAKSEGDQIAAGEEVTVIEQDGLKLIVTMTVSQKNGSG